MIVDRYQSCFSRSNAAALISNGRFIARDSGVMTRNSRFIVRNTSPMIRKSGLIASNPSFQPINLASIGLHICSSGR